MMEYYKYKIVVAPNSALYHIKAQGKGSVHNTLRGYYTDKGAAMKAIDHYEATKGAKKDGKAVSN